MEPVLICPLCKKPFDLFYCSEWNGDNLRLMSRGEPREVINQEALQAFRKRERQNSYGYIHECRYGVTGEVFTASMVVPVSPAKVLHNPRKVVEA
jgi:hypothetical protein